MDNGENDAPILGVDSSELDTACLKLAELSVALAIVQAARRGASDQNRHASGSFGGKKKTRQSFGRQRVPSSARDQRQARHTVAGRAWDRAYRQLCAGRGIGHLINVMPESEVYRFGNGGLLTSTERVTVPVVLADHPVLLPYSVVESPVLSLLIGGNVV